MPNEGNAMGGSIGETSPHAHHSEAALLHNPSTRRASCLRAGMSAMKKVSIPVDEISQHRAASQPSASAGAESAVAAYMRRRPSVPPIAPACAPAATPAVDASPPGGGTDDEEMAMAASFVVRKPSAPAAPAVVDIPTADLLWTGPFADPEYEDDFREFYLRRAFETHVPRSAGLLACVFLVVATVEFSVESPAPSVAYGKLAISLSLLCLAAYVPLARALRLGLRLTEAVCTLVLCAILGFAPVVLQRARLALAFGSAGEGEGGGAGEAGLAGVSAGSLDAHTMLEAVLLAFFGVFMPLSAPAFALAVSVAVGSSALTAALLPLPGMSVADEAYVTTALGLVGLALLYGRRHAALLERGQFHLHRTVQLEAQERRHAQRLEQRRTVQLTSAQDAKQARARLIRVVMHDLRSPLLAASGVVALLKALPPDRPVGSPDVQHQVGAMGECVNAIEQSVSDMLDFERIDSGRLVLVLNPMRISQLVDSALLRFGAAARNKKIRLVAEPLPPVLDSMHFLGDIRRLQQCVHNGVSNALKFTDAGGCISLRVWETVHAQGHEGWRHVHLAVMDTGVGLEPADLEQLHSADPFTQVGQGLLQGSGGTGLGLSITRQILKLHSPDSELRLSSPGAGRGLTFELDMALLLWGAEAAHSPPTGVRGLGGAHGRQAAAKGAGVDRGGGLPAPRPAVYSSPGGTPRILKAPLTGPAASQTADSTPNGDGRAAAARMPSALSRDPASPAPPNAAAAGTSARGGGGGGGGGVGAGALTFPPSFRVLHAEDDLMIRKILPLRTFKRLGVAYDQAENGVEAVEMVTQGGREYDLILIDNQMPRMSGTEATRQIRAWGYTGVIIGMTGDPAGCIERSEFEAAGLNAVIDKDTAGNEYLLQVLRGFAVDGGATEEAEAQQRPTPAAAAAAASESRPGPPAAPERALPAAPSAAPTAAQPLAEGGGAGCSAAAAAATEHAAAAAGPTRCGSAPLTVSTAASSDDGSEGQAAAADAIAIDVTPSAAD